MQTMSRRNIKLLISVFLILFTYAYNNFNKYKLSQPPQITPIPLISPTPKVLSASDSATLATVTRVIDGDTIEVIINSVKQKVRYIGINAPETVAPRKPVACFGREASDKNKELVLGKTVRLEKDISETDKYGRLLRYAYVVSPERLVSEVEPGVEGLNGSDSVNNLLVKSGYAYSSTYPPDVKYQKIFQESLKYAKEQKLGLWGKCF